MNIRAIARKVVTRLIRPHYEYMRDNPAYRTFDIGRFTYGRPLVMWGHEARLRIGSFCSIGDGTRILLGGNHHFDWVSTYPFPAKKDFTKCAGAKDISFSKGDVVIGNDVWIGQDVMILSGVTIGDGAVVGAQSLVVKDIPPYAIAGGNPAKVIRMRFPAEQVEALLQIAWWNWPLDRIKKSIPMLLDSDILDFIASASGIDRKKPSEPLPPL